MGYARSSLLLLTLVLALPLAGCDAAESPNQSVDANAAEPQPAPPALPLPMPALGRAELLQAVIEAASARAAGTDDAAAQRPLDGRQFELRIRFGCRGPSSELPNEWLGWSYDAEQTTLRVRAMPTLSLDDQMVAQIGTDQFEAVEGFWIPRPWLLHAVCPAGIAAQQQRREATAERETSQAATPESGPAPTQEPVPSAVLPRVGIAQFFTETDARTARRAHRAYEAVKALTPAQPVGSQGFNLVLSGRLRALPRRPVIQCLSKSADVPPDCIVTADFDRVWIEAPESREVIAEWRQS